MSMSSNEMQRRYIVDQPNQPGGAAPPYQWINRQGGANGNNRETYLWNASSGAWELVRSRGPDTPTREVEGSFWRDTANGEMRQYDGASWVFLANVFESTTQPSPAQAGDLWRDTSGNNTELHQYDGASWETWFARGPDNPEYPVEGTIWRDTGAGELKQYNGASFEGIGVTDHSNLSNVQASQHHTKALEPYKVDRGSVTLNANETYTTSVNDPPAVGGYDVRASADNNRAYIAVTFVYDSGYSPPWRDVNKSTSSAAATNGTTSIGFENQASGGETWEFSIIGW